MNWSTQTPPRRESQAGSSLPGKVGEQVASLTSIEAQLRILQDYVEEIGEDRERLRNVRQELHALRHGLSGRVLDLKREAIRLAHQQRNLDDQYRALESRRREINERLRQLEQREALLADAEARWTRREQALLHEAAFRADRTAASEKLQAEADARQAQILAREAELTAARQALEQECTDLTRRQAALTALQEEIESDRAALDRDRESLLEQRARLEEERRNLQSAMATATPDRAVSDALLTQDLSARTADLAEREERLRARETELTRAEEALCRNRSDLSERENRLHAREADLSRATDTLERDRKDLSERDDQLRARQAELTRFEEALGRNRSDFIERENRLRAQEADLNRAAETLEQDRKDLSGREDRLRAQETDLNRLAKTVESDRAALSERDADLTSQRENLAADRLALDRQREALDERHKVLEAGTVALDDRTAALERDRRQLHEQRVSLQCDRDDIERERGELRRQREEFDAVRSALANEREVLGQAQTELAAGQDHLRTSLEALSAQQASLAARSDGIEQQRRDAETLSSHLSALQADLTRREAALADARTRQEAADLASRQRQANLESREKAVASLESTLADRKSRIARAEAELAGRTRTLQTQSKTLDSNKADIDRRAESLARRESEIRALQKELADREARVKADRADLQKEASAAAGKHDTRAELALIEQQRMDVQRRLHELDVRSIDHLAEEQKLLQERQTLEAERETVTRLTQELEGQRERLNAEIQESRQAIERDREAIESQRLSIERTADELAEERAELNRLRLAMETDPVHRRQGPELVETLGPDAPAAVGAVERAGPAKDGSSRIPDSLSVPRHAPSAAPARHRSGRRVPATAFLAFVMAAAVGIRSFVTTAPQYRVQGALQIAKSDDQDAVLQRTMDAVENDKVLETAAGAAGTDALLMRRDLEITTVAADAGAGPKVLIAHITDVPESAQAQINARLKAVAEYVNNPDHARLRSRLDALTGQIKTAQKQMEDLHARLPAADPRDEQKRIEAQLADQMLARDKLKAEYDAQVERVAALRRNADSPKGKLTEEDVQNAFAADRQIRTDTTQLNLRLKTASQMLIEVLAGSRDRFKAVHAALDAFDRTVGDQKKRLKDLNAIGTFERMTLDLLELRQQAESFERMWTDTLERLQKPESGTPANSVIADRANLEQALKDMSYNTGQKLTVVQKAMQQFGASSGAGEATASDVARSAVDSSISDLLQAVNALYSDASKLLIEENFRLKNAIDQVAGLTRRIGERKATVLRQAQASADRKATEDYDRLLHEAVRQVETVEQQRSALWSAIEQTQKDMSRLPGDILLAEQANAAFNQARQNLTKLQEEEESVQKELSSLLQTSARKVEIAEAAWPETPVNTQKRLQSAATSAVITFFLSGFLLLLGGWLVPSRPRL